MIAILIIAVVALLVLVWRASKTHWKLWVRYSIWWLLIYTGGFFFFSFTVYPLPPETGWAFYVGILVTWLLARREYNDRLNKVAAEIVMSPETWSVLAQRDPEIRKIVEEGRVGAVTQAILIQILGSKGAAQ